MIARVYNAHNIVLQIRRSKYDVSAERRDWYGTRDLYSKQRRSCYYITIIYISPPPWEFHARLIKDGYLHEMKLNVMLQKQMNLMEQLVRRPAKSQIPSSKA